MLKYARSLLFCRLCFLLTFLFFVFSLYKELCKEIELAELEVEQHKSREASIKWDEINLEIPPFLNNSELEKSRLHELLAVSQYHCPLAKGFGDDTERYDFCIEQQHSIEKVLVITGNSRSRGIFEKELNASNWVIFLPVDNQLVESLQGDVEVNYMTEIARWNHWQTWEIRLAMKNRVFDVVKFDLTTSYFKSYDQPSVIKELIQVVSSSPKHLALSIPLVAENTQKEVVLVAEWYRLLYWLFFEKHYAIISSSFSGTCHKENYHNCVYRVSLFLPSDPEKRTAPVFGLGEIKSISNPGSPTEERKRLRRYLTQVIGSCDVIENPNFPPFCKDEKLDSAIVIRYHSNHSQISFPSKLAKKNIIISPETDNVPQYWEHIRSGLSIDSETSTTDGKWKLQPLDVLLSRFETSARQLVMFDMQGGEWAVLPQILHAIKTRRYITQIVIRGRIFPEENENYRSFYWHLRRFKYHGFQNSLSQMDDNRFDVVFNRL